jgi:hypothetical protein
VNTRLAELPLTPPQVSPFQSSLPKKRIRIIKKIRSANELIESIYASVAQFRETTPQADDMTLVVLKTL